MNFAVFGPGYALYLLAKDAAAIPDALTPGPPIRFIHGSAAALLHQIPGRAARACLPYAQCTFPKRTLRSRLTWPLPPAHPADRHLLSYHALGLQIRAVKYP
jgi:hypothetical protein